MAKYWRAAVGVRSTIATSWSLYSSSCGRKSEYHTIMAVPREITGSRISARDRAQGRIPAVVFTERNLSDASSVSDQATTTMNMTVSRKHLITAEKDQIEAIIRSVQPEFFCSTKFHLQIHAGSASSLILESGVVLPIKIHKDIKTGKLLNLVFVWAEEGSQLKVDVPVVLKGMDSCPGLRKGGMMRQVRMSLKYLCPTEHIPQKIEVDVSNLDIGDKLLLHDVEVHPSMRIIRINGSTPICVISANKPSQRKEGHLE